VNGATAGGGSAQTTERAVEAAVAVSTTDPRAGRVSGELKGAAVQRLRDERGEGVISMAIAVLIVAAIGLAMWVTFDRIFDDAGDKVEDNVNQIG
jgi:hypothetical protein